jgi:hypothetical protein
MTKTPAQLDREIAEALARPIGAAVDGNKCAASALGYAGSRHAASYACLKPASVASEVERITETSASR